MRPSAEGADRAVLPLADAIAARLSGVAARLAAGMPTELEEAVTPVTRRLLRWWFRGGRTDAVGPRFHRGQMEAILAVVYAHEVVGASTLEELYAAVCPEALADDETCATVTDPASRHAKYLVKMATGTGKTWVLDALLIWQYLNAVAAPDDPRFSKNALVVTPGLIVRDRMLDSLAGRRRRGGGRDQATSDIARFRSLFLPDDDAEQVLRFLGGAVVEGDGIARSLADGVVAVVNWHLFLGDRSVDGPDPAADPSQASPDPRAIAESVVPLAPGSGAGNALERLDRAAQRGEAFRLLLGLPSLVVFDDEAHHVQGRAAGAPGAIAWQAALMRLSESKLPPTGGRRRFTQIDFSATPFREGGGRRGTARRRYLDHIVTDFDLAEAMRAGLVKALTLDRRAELTPLDVAHLGYGAERDDAGVVVGLSAGQRIMLAAGLTKLAALEVQFASVDPSKRPRMLVVLEDTSVAPFVEAYLGDELGVADADRLSIHSGTRSGVSPAEWERIRDRLSGPGPRPRVIISVLMLREGFDVDDICVIVPLRTAGAGILLEQIIGRGLRLMWRDDPVIDEAKRRTRRLIGEGREPASAYDVLFVVDHPNFDAWYRQTLGDGLVGMSGTDSPSDVRDVVAVGPRDGAQRYDIVVPVVVAGREEELADLRVDPDELPPSRFPFEAITMAAAGGGTFRSVDALDGVNWGRYQVGALSFGRAAYQRYLIERAESIAAPVGRVFTGDGAILPAGADPRAAILQSWRGQALGLVKAYIERRYFGRRFDPLLGENWRALLVPAVRDDIDAGVRRALLDALGRTATRDPEVVHRRVGEVERITVSLSASVPVAKCVYPRMSVSCAGGDLERAFIRWLDSDAEVQAFARVTAHEHDFLRIPYLRADGRSASFAPDFLVRSAREVFLVRIAPDAGVTGTDAPRLRRAATEWIRSIGDLPAAARSWRDWDYVLLSEGAVRSAMGSGIGVLHAFGLGAL